ncbi:hypothetical protein PR048_009520 [Dryococelus australis]|uniref:Uncharacterized protein n=1 Tax=Dryococelus australis TaxID=614101 RepID=A0ABQ9I080_9NEOP|nr:hypothetical protein PR048_009520 [Dryococelus australis]
MAIQRALKNNISHSFSKTTNIAGRKIGLRPKFIPPTTDGQLQIAGQDELLSEQHSPSAFIPFHVVEIRALPKVQPPSCKRNGGESIVLTSSPYKKKVEDFYTRPTAKGQNSSDQASNSGTVQKRPTAAGQNKSNQNPATNKKKNISPKGRKHKVSSSSDTEDSNEPPLVDTDDDDLDVELDDPDSRDATCTFCNERISDDFSGQQWVMYSLCFNCNH